MIAVLTAPPYSDTGVVDRGMNKNSWSSWYVKPLGRQPKYELTRDVTWADIKECMLSLNGKDGETFAPLARCEGGLECVSCPEFQSSTSRKAIRFQGQGGSAIGRGGWHNVFLDNCEDDTVVLHDGECVYLDFEGQNCKAWTRRQCRDYADIIVKTFSLVFPPRTRHPYP